MNDQDKDSEQHGIQLNYVGVKEFHFDSIRLPGSITPDELDDTELTSGRSSYDCMRHTISMLVKAEVKTRSENMHLRVELIAEFRVDESVFPADKVEDWAEKAGMFILMPFLREHVFSLSTRVGLSPVILPMMTLPPYRITPPASPEPEEQTIGAAAASL